MSVLDKDRDWTKAQAKRMNLIDEKNQVKNDARRLEELDTKIRVLREKSWVDELNARIMLAQIQHSHFDTDHNGKAKRQTQADRRRGA